MKLRFINSQIVNSTKKHLGVAAVKGETIVEVMIALSILSLVLGFSYSSANRSLIMARTSQERSEAVKLAESQVELMLNNLSGGSRAIFRTDPFCMLADASGIQDLPAGTPSIDPASDNFTAYAPECIVNGLYHVGVRPDRDANTYEYWVTVRWERLGGGGANEATLGYKLVDRPGSVATAPTPAFPPPVGNNPVCPTDDQSTAQLLNGKYGDPVFPEWIRANHPTLSIADLGGPDLAAGTYSIQVVSWDQHFYLDGSPHPPQPYEQWQLEFYDAANNLLATSAVTIDIPDHSNFQETILTVHVPGVATRFVAKHLYWDSDPPGGPLNGGQNSVVPLCANLRLIAPAHVPSPPPPGVIDGGHTTTTDTPETLVCPITANPDRDVIDFDIDAAKMQSYAFLRGPFNFDTPLLGGTFTISFASYDDHYPGWDDVNPQLYEQAHIVFLDAAGNEIYKSPLSIDIPDLGSPIYQTTIFTNQTFSGLATQYQFVRGDDYNPTSDHTTRGSFHPVCMGIERTGP